MSQRSAVGRRTLTPRTFWQPLTPRGRTLLVAGAVLLAAGLTLGQIDLVRIGVFAAVLPVVAVVVVTRARLRIACERHSDPPVAVAGTSVQVVLTLTNRSLVPIGAMHLEDRMPAHLDGQARFTLAGLGPQQSRAVTYRLADVRRGRYVTGPLRIRIDDAFGLVDIVRSFAGRSDVLVTPRIEPLSAPGPAVAWDVGDSAGSRSVGTHGAEDASIREYRHGDDLRKIHWRSTARTGMPMVRQDERPQQGRVTVVLDLRRVAHAVAPSGRDDTDVEIRQRDSLEWAVSAAASVAGRMLVSSRDTGLLHDSDRSAALPTRIGLAGTRDVAEHLAEVGGTGGADLRRLLPAVRVAARDSVLVAVLGGLDPSSLEALLDVSGSSTRVGGSLLAILVDVDGWRRGGSAAAEPAAAARLRAAGWLVAVARHGEDVTTVWDRLLTAGGSSRFDIDAVRAIGLS